MPGEPGLHHAVSVPVTDMRWAGDRPGGVCYMCSRE